MGKQRLALSASMFPYAIGAAIAAINPSATAAIDFTQQQNYLSAEIASETATVENPAIGSFDDAVKVQSPHAGADLKVTSEQVLELADDLSHGNALLDFDGMVEVDGSDLYDDDSGGGFPVVGIIQTTIGFTLHNTSTFEVHASAWKSSSQSLADVFLFKEVDDELVPMISVGTYGNTEAQQTVTLEAGTYMIDAYAEFTTLGPGEWTESTGYDFSMTVAECLGDFNGDGVVDGDDLMMLLDNWGACGASAPCQADLNGDGVIDVQDLLKLIDHWGKCSS